MEGWDGWMDGSPGGPRYRASTVLITIDKRVFRGDQVHYTAVYCIASLLRRNLFVRLWNKAPGSFNMLLYCNFRTKSIGGHYSINWLWHFNWMGKVQVF